MSKTKNSLLAIHRALKENPLPKTPGIGRNISIWFDKDHWVVEFSDDLKSRYIMTLDEQGFRLPEYDRIARIIETWVHRGIVPMTDTIYQVEP